MVTSYPGTNIKCFGVPLRPLFLGLRRGKYPHLLSSGLDVAHNTVVALSKEISFVNLISTFYTLEMGERGSRIVEQVPGDVL